MFKKIMQVIKIIFEMLQKVILLIPLTIIIYSFDTNYFYSKNSIRYFILITFFLYAIGMLIGKISSNKIKLIRYLLIVILTIFISLIKFKMGHMSLFSFILIIIYLYRGSALYYYETTNLCYLSSIIGYCIIAFFIRRGVIEFPYCNQINILGVISLLIVLFNLNIKQVKSADKRNTGLIYNEIKKYNCHLVVIVLIIIFFMSSGYELINSLLLTIKNGIHYIILFIQNLFHRDNHIIIEDIKPHKPLILPNDGYYNSESILGKIIYYILVVVAFVIVIVGCILLIIKLYKIIKKLVNSILSRLMTNERVEQLYEEKSEKLMNVEELKKKYSEIIKNKIKKILSKPENWNELSNRDKIRYLYKLSIEKLIRKGYKPLKNMTPNEVVQDIKEQNYKETLMNKKFINIYNQARYSKHIIENKQIEEYNGNKQ